MTTLKEFLNGLKKRHSELLHITWESPGDNYKEGMLIVTMKNINLKSIKEILSELKKWFKFTDDNVHIRALDGKMLEKKLYASIDEETLEEKKHLDWVASLEDEDPERFSIEREKINREGYKRKLNYLNTIICMIEFQNIVKQKN